MSGPAVIGKAGYGHPPEDYGHMPAGETTLPLKWRDELRPTFESIYMDLAFAMASRSTCERLQVGCVIATTDHRKVLAVGYNGGAAGLENECESLEPGKCGHLHAEENAIINLDCPRGVPKRVYLTHLPCAMCAKRMINVGSVQSVRYAEDYRDRSSVRLLERAGISVIHQLRVPAMSTWAELKAEPEVTYSGVDCAAVGPRHIAGALIPPGSHTAQGIVEHINAGSSTHTARVMGVGTGTVSIELTRKKTGAGPRQHVDGWTKEEGEF